MVPCRMNLPRQTLRALRASDLRELCVKSIPIRHSCILFAFFRKHRSKCDPLTPSFSIAGFHSSSLFITLKPVSPLLATLTQSMPGYTLLPPNERQHSKLTPLNSILTQTPSRNSFKPNTYEKQGGPPHQIVPCSTFSFPVPVPVRQRASPQCLLHPNPS